MMILTTFLGNYRSFINLRIMGIFNRKSKEEETSSHQLAKELYIKQITLNSSRDYPLLQHNLLDGHIMVVNLQPLAKIANRESPGSTTLHVQLQKIKRYCLKNGGSVVKLQEGTLLITPNNQFKIAKS